MVSTGRSDESLSSVPWNLPLDDLEVCMEHSLSDLRCFEGARLLLTGVPGFLGSWILAHVLHAKQSSPAQYACDHLEPKSGTTSAPSDTKPRACTRRCPFTCRPWCVRCRYPWRRFIRTQRPRKYCGKYDGDNCWRHRVDLESVAGQGTRLLFLSSALSTVLS